MDDWREIVKKAVEKAQGYHGAKERAWITALLLGKEPMSLFRLATLEASGYSPDDDIKQAVESEKLSRQWTTELTVSELHTDAKKS